MTERDVIYENGDYWVRKVKSVNAAIAPLGSIYYQTMAVIGVASYSHGKLGLPFYTASLDRAIRHCDRIAAQLDAIPQALEATA